MCGIAGIWRPGGFKASWAESVVTAMAQTLRHRGPDAGAIWHDPHAGIGLGHRRLSIVDLSDAGAQPMQSPSGRFVIVFNGEIYNHVEIRHSIDEEEPQRWRGHSDTETLAAAIERWGVDRSLGRLEGMFAFAAWDRRERCITLARDRLGEKPLYYGMAGPSMIFGSELKALRVAPGFDETLDHASVASFVRFGYVPEPASIYLKVRKLPAGCKLTIRNPGTIGTPEPYWTLQQAIQNGETHPLLGEHTAVVDRVEQALEHVIGSQMLTDVPIGCFLSGGIDSTLVAALMQRAAGRPVRTFSIGFGLPQFNEAAHARQTARHLGTDHTEYTVTESDALDLVPELPAIYDEPFADSSQIPTTLLARLARQDVTVALTGDGGDEIFGGYNRHFMLPALWRRLRHLPPAGRRALGHAMQSARTAGWRESRFAAGAGRLLGLPITTFDKVGLLGEAVTGASDYETFYGGVVSMFPHPEAVLAAPGPGHGTATRLGDLDPTRWTMAMDTLTYLPGDILVKVDRAAMSASLETRCPLLDRRIVELAWRLPLESRVQGKRGKRVLRDIVARHVPPELVDRPKQGFSIPLDRWLRGELRPWAEELLAPRRLRAAGLFNAEEVGRLLNRHLAGEQAGSRLWTILMLQAWWEGHMSSAQLSGHRIPA